MKIKKGFVSIIIPTYNQAEYVSESIRSALNQTWADKEVVVIDDGSTDKTQEVLSAFGENIICLKKNNGGPASARNLGIENASGEYIAFLDSDDIWVQEKLEKQLAYFEENPNVDILIASPEVKGYEHVDYGLSVKSRIRDGFIFNTLLQENFINTSTVIVKRKVLDKIGLFDEDRSLISVEDINLWLRIAREHKFGFLNFVVVKKRMHEKALTHNYENMFKADFYNYEKLKNDFPEWNLQKNKNYWQGYANYCYKFGDCLFSEREYRKAKQYLGKSIKYGAISLKGVIMYIATFFPVKVIDLIRSHKKNV